LRNKGQQAIERRKNAKSTTAGKSNIKPGRDCGTV
jgi:hypothetical protein